jgi:hypothetical protein
VEDKVIMGREREEKEGEKRDEGGDRREEREGREVGSRGREGKLLLKLVTELLN